jgi:hypothetical protein
MRPRSPQRTGLWNARAIIRELKKGQDLLGRVHDRQELLDAFAANSDSYPEGSDRGQLELVTQVVEAEAHDLHRRYLSRRERLLEAALTAERAVSRARMSVLPAAGLLAASSALLLVRRRIAARVM